MKYILTKVIRSAYGNTIVPLHNIFDDEMQAMAACHNLTNVLDSAGIKYGFEPILDNTARKLQERIIADPNVVFCLSDMRDE